MALNFKKILLFHVCALKFMIFCNMALPSWGVEVASGKGWNFDKMSSVLCLFSKIAVFYKVSSLWSLWILKLGYWYILNKFKNLALKYILKYPCAKFFSFASRNFHSVAHTNKLIGSSFYYLYKYKLLVHYIFSGVAVQDFSSRKMRVQVTFFFIILR